MDAGSYVLSDTFRVGGYDWKVHFYPHGEDTTATEYVSVFLELDGLDDVEASFEFTFLDQSRNGGHYSYSGRGIELHTKTCMCFKSYRICVRSISVRTSRLHQCRFALCYEITGIPLNENSPWVVGVVAAAFASQRLKRDNGTLSVDENGTKTLIWNCCQNVIRVGGEEEEIQNVKA
ncbi:BTB/POZ/MATH-domains containing protein [Tanacetum coccineum]|uniref:BTB/POZ/MATH-domains containing protein n=1 Tax=Tanacetum coccineum TaxID=301880 RepID=A0ABQ4Z2E2_9ASTR